MTLSVPEKKAILAIADLAALACSIAVAFAFVANIPSLAALEFPSQGFWSFVFGLLLLLVAYLNDCLDITSLRSTRRYLRRWWVACILTACLYLVGFFVFGRAAAISDREFGLPRVVPALTLCVAAFLIPVIRLLAERFLGLGSGRKKCIVVGAGSSGRDFVEKATLVPSEWKVCALVDDDPTKLGTTLRGSVVVGSCADLPRLVQEHHAEEVILAITHEMNAEAIEALMTCFEQGIDIVPVVSATERALGRVPLQHLGNRWLPSTFWASDPMPLFYDVFKRGVDLTLALALLVPAAPVIAVAAILTRFTSKGPSFYRQYRVGMHGSKLTIIKIRTMVADAERNGAQWASAADPRVTPLGKFMRATRIDELPQLWNVLKGEMSLVGPRPERPEFVEQLAKEIPFYRARLAVRPGLTGWAQIKHRYANSVEDTKTKLEYDLFYIKNRCIRLDILILAKTAKTVVTFCGQ